MAMPVQQGEWTAELARALPEDGNRYEVLDGELFVTPAPALLHQRALLELYDRLKPYVVAHGLGEVLLSPADIEFSPKRLIQPDLFVIPDAPSGRRKTWREVKSLLLAVEALCACQAIDFRAPLETSAPLARVHACIRVAVPTLTEDRPPAPDIEAVAGLIASGAIEDAAGLTVK